MNPQDYFFRHHIIALQFQLELWCNEIVLSTALQEVLWIGEDQKVEHQSNRQII